MSQSCVAFIPEGVTDSLLHPGPAGDTKNYSQEPHHVPAVLGAWALLPREGSRGGKWELHLQTPCLMAPGVTILPWVRGDITLAHWGVWPSLPPISARKPVRALDTSWYQLPLPAPSRRVQGPPDILLQRELLEGMSSSCHRRLLQFLPVLPCSAHLSLGSDSASPPLSSLPCYSLQFPCSLSAPLKTAHFRFRLGFSQDLGQCGCPAFPVTVAAEPCPGTVTHCGSMGCSKGHLLPGEQTLKVASLPDDAPSPPNPPPGWYALIILLHWEHT